MSQTTIKKRICILLVVALMGALAVGCGQKDVETGGNVPDVSNSVTPSESPSEAPSESGNNETAITRVADVPIPAVPDVTTERAYGVVSAEEWSSHYPEIYASWKATENNKGTNGSRIAYTEQDPDIQILYQGMGFAFDYTEAVGHVYTLQDIEETTRPHKLANCLTCKTPDYTALVNDMGAAAYSLDFEEVFAQVSESVSCYTCHGNTPGTMVIEHDYTRDAWSDEVEAGTMDPINVSCGQCHIEYYFDPDTKATRVPYDSTSNFDPDSILAYYDEMGFIDFTNENTGVGQIKVQHPELETYTGAGSVHAGTFNCADCHMGVAYASDGTAYVNHEFTNPQDNAGLMESTCAACHDDLSGMIKDIQTEITGREAEISAMLVEINQKLAAAIEKGALSEEDLAKVRSLDRDAQFYWDFVYVENSEGAHNSKLSRECLDKAESIAKEALALLEG
ncbi:MAG: ammonia-forming cytochrome c nitrite reductase subunit c552 [Ruminococcus flavefaciens]|nr:ammonia-forming cytochrome c nitrite reductase subunit c552 [Ruminococcus flavefaciens]